MPHYKIKYRPPQGGIMLYPPPQVSTLKPPLPSPLPANNGKPPSEVIVCLQSEIDRLISLANQVQFLSRICVFKFLIDHIYKRIFGTITALSNLINQISEN